MQVKFRFAGVKAQAISRAAALWLTDFRYASDVSVCWVVKSETQLSNSLRQSVQKV